MIAAVPTTHTRDSRSKEARSMTDHPAKTIYSAMNEDAKRGPLAKPLLIARAIAIVAAVAGAIPTGHTIEAYVTEPSPDMDPSVLRTDLILPVR
mgnify:CR=1 FL=1